MKNLVDVEGLDGVGNQSTMIGGVSPKKASLAGKVNPVKTKPQIKTIPITPAVPSTPKKKPAVDGRSSKSTTPGFPGIAAPKDALPDTQTLLQSDSWKELASKRKNAPDDDEDMPTTAFSSTLIGNAIAAAPKTKKTDDEDMPTTAFKAPLFPSVKKSTMEEEEDMPTRAMPSPSLPSVKKKKTVTEEEDLPTKAMPSPSLAKAKKNTAEEDEDMPTTAFDATLIGSAIKDTPKIKPDDTMQTVHGEEEDIPTMAFDSEIISDATSSKAKENSVAQTVLLPQSSSDAVDETALMPPVVERMTVTSIPAPAASIAPTPQDIPVMEHPKTKRSRKGLLGILAAAIVLCAAVATYLLIPMEQKPQVAQSGVNSPAAKKTAAVLRVPAAAPPKAEPIVEPQPEPQPEPVAAAPVEIQQEEPQEEPDEEPQEEAKPAVQSLGETKVNVTFPGTYRKERYRYATLNPHKLGDIIDELQECGGNIEVVGHSCGTGTTDYNLEISLKRAELVRKVLIKKGSFDPNRVTAKARGADEPIRSNSTEAGRKANRRVTITCD